MTAMSQNNVFDYMWLQRQKDNLQSYRDQTNHFYTTENEHLKHRNRFEIEQYRANLTKDLEYQKGNSALELERQRQHGKLEIEEKRGILSQWIEKFRKESSKELETHRQTGALTLQEREHIHQKSLTEISLQERTLELDTQHARALEVSGQAEEFARFREQREQTYVIDVKRFDALLNERKDISEQMLQEYTTRNGQASVLAGFTSNIFQEKSKSNARMNEKILDVALGIFLSKQQAKLDKSAETTAKNAIDEQIRKWDSGGS